MNVHPVIIVANILFLGTIVILVAHNLVRQARARRRAFGLLGVLDAETREDVLYAAGRFLRFKHAPEAAPPEEMRREPPLARLHKKKALMPLLHAVLHATSTAAVTGPPPEKGKLADEIEKLIPRNARSVFIYHGKDESLKLGVLDHDEAEEFGKRLSSLMEVPFVSR